MSIRIALTGPECTGKTTLARELAAYFHTLWVPEYAREYIGRLDRPYTLSDIEQIGLRQLALEGAAAEKANQFLICDSDLFVLKIWTENAFGSCPAWIDALIHSKPYALHLLCVPDLNWEADPQREHPHLRWELFERYRTALNAAKAPYCEIRGVGPERLQTALRAIEMLRKD